MWKDGVRMSYDFRDGHYLPGTHVGNCFTTPRNRGAYAHFTHEETGVWRAGAFRVKAPGLSGRGWDLASSLSDPQAWVLIVHS